MQNIPFYTSVREYRLYQHEFNNAIDAVLERGDFILGKDVLEFEEACRGFTQAKHAIAVASGSDALVLAADVLGFKDGAEVITPAFTFYASASCLARLKAKPVFTDVDEYTFNIDVPSIEEKITPKTKGILPVHLFSQTCNMKAILELCQKKSLFCLEDAAEAWGMNYILDGRPIMAGLLGDIGIFSFFPTKTLGAYGDAGLIVTNNDQYAEELKKLRVHGSAKKYYHNLIGYNSRLDTIQAAILKIKLKYSMKSILRRAQIAKHYMDRLCTIPEIRLPYIADNCSPVWYVFNILVPRREQLIGCLEQNDIGYSVYYPVPLHLQKCFEYLGYKKGDFPVAEKICERTLALPIFPELQDDEVDRVCDVLENFFRRNS